jgi:YHS domain-containing protein
LSLLAALAVGTAALSDAQSPASGSGEGRSSGMWKAAVPPKPMNGEFDGFDPLGVEAGARIKADCSLNWTSPDDGKRYCFSSGTSLEFFLDQPQAHLERARAGWRRMILPQE